MQEGYTEIFAWGGDHFGQLGLGNKHSGKSYSSPRFCSFNILIKEISCGEEHSAFISSLGHVYSMGSNSDGRLGLGDKSLRHSSSPCLVEGLLNHRCLKISCGWGHSVAITEDGSVFSWGVGEFGALGSGSHENQWSPFKVPLARTMRGLDSNCGSRHTGLIVEDGRSRVLLMCGSGEAGQLGTGKREKEYSFVAVTVNEDVQAVACGIFHSLVLAASGKVYAMGGNSFGQLGLGNKKSCSKPERVPLDANIVKIACGSHSAAVSDKGQLFLWGSGVFGEFLQPTKVINTGCRDVAVGGSFGVTLDSLGNLHAWGANSNGELGLGDHESRSTPSLILSLKGKNATKISCGGNYTIALGVDLVNEGRFEGLGEVQKLGKREEVKKEEFKAKGLRVKARNSSVELEFNKVSEVDGRISRVKEIESDGKLKEFERNNSNYRQISNKYEDLKIELLRANEKNSQLRLENQRIERDLEEIRKGSEFSIKDAQIANSQLRSALEDSQRQNNSLLTDLRISREETTRLKNLIEDLKHSSKLETCQKVDDLNQTLTQKYQIEVSNIRLSEEQEIIKRKQLEKSMEISSKHIANLEDALHKSSSQVSSLQLELEKFYNESTDLERRLDMVSSEKNRLEESLRQQRESLTQELHSLQLNLEKTLMDKEKLSQALKSENEGNYFLVSEHKHQLDSLNSEKDRITRSLQSEIASLHDEQSHLHSELSKLSSEKQEILKLLNQKSSDLKFSDSELSVFQSQISSQKQEIEQLVYEINRFKQNEMESVNMIDKLTYGIGEWEESYKVLLEENKILKESVCELEMKNRQLFENLERELAQRAKEYKERTIAMLGNGRNSSPYVRPGTPVMLQRENTEEVYRVETTNSPGTVKNTQYLTISQAYRGTTTPTKEDVRVRIASLMKNRSRIEEQIQNLNQE